jgi:hypothetical protein
MRNRQEHKIKGKNSLTKQKGQNQPLLVRVKFVVTPDTEQRLRRAFDLLLDREYMARKEKAAEKSYKKLGIPASTYLHEEMLDNSDDRDQGDGG